MKIHKLELDNYRQYGGKHVLELDTDDKHNLNIILGANGSGKTNLLNAINWCMYGDEPSLEKTKSELQQCIANERELANKNHVIVRVGLYLGNEQPQFYFERTLNVTGTPQSPEERERTWHAAYLEGGNWKSYKGNDWREMTQFYNIVSYILPLGIRNFFLFDGERLNDFFRKGMEHEVKNAIIKVCQIGLLDNCIDHLSSRYKDIRKGLKAGASSEIKKISEQIDSMIKSKEKLKGEIEQLSDRITEATKNKEDIEDKLRKYIGHDVDELQKERDRLEINIQKLDMKIGKKEKDIKNHFGGSLPYILCYDSLKESYKLIDERKKGIKKPRIPPDIRERFLEDLLKTKQCICGTELLEDSPQRREIEKIKTTITLSSKLSDAADVGYYRIDNILKRYKNFQSQRSNLEKEYLEMNGERITLDQRLKEISDKLKGIPIEEIQNLERLRDNFEDQIRRCIAERAQKEFQMKGLEDRIKIRNDDLRKEIEKDKKQEKLRLKLELCEKSIEAINGIKEKVVSEIRETVQEKTKEYFFSLHWKTGAFKDVIINEGYEISLLNILGSECLGSISAGETQLLALSFMAALSSVSGFDAPVIIDTPLGRISGVPKEKVAASLPNYLKNSQITLLITDQEYTPTVKNNMKSRINREFELKYYEDEMKTEIEAMGGEA